MTKVSHDFFRELSDRSALLSDVSAGTTSCATAKMSLLLRLRALSCKRLPFGDVHILALFAVRILVSECDAFERNARIDIRLRVREEDILFPVCLVVVHYVPARGISCLQATVTFQVRSLRCARLLGHCNQA